jgi:hypothetical protein
MFTGPIDRQRIEANVAESGVCAASEPAAVRASKTRVWIVMIGGKRWRANTFSL